MGSTLVRKQIENSYFIICRCSKSQRQLSMLQELAFFCSDLENIQRLSDCRTIDEAQKFWLKPKVTSEKIGSKNQFILKCSIII